MLTVCMNAIAVCVNICLTVCVIV